MLNAPQGIASVLIENPFYGVRKPKEQWENCLLHLSDLFVAVHLLFLCHPHIIILFLWISRRDRVPG